MNTLMLIGMIESMLNDDHGVSEQTYQYLRDLVDSADDDIRERLSGIMRKVDATEGRFYLPIE